MLKEDKVKTIGHNQLKKAERIFMNAQNIKAYSLSNGFDGQKMPNNLDSRRWLFQQWTAFKFARLTQKDENNQYGLRITSNEFYGFEARL